MSYLLRHSWAGNDRHEMPFLSGPNRDIMDECSVRCAPERERYAPVEVVGRLVAEVGPVGGRMPFTAKQKLTLL